MTSATTQDAAKYQVALGSIDSSKPKPILLNVESGVKTFIAAIAKNEKIEGIDIDPTEFAKLPNSQTGVTMHFIVKGRRRSLVLVLIPHQPP